MALFTAVRIAVLLGTLGLICTLGVDAYKSSSNYRQDARFGRPVLAMANSPRCMLDGRPVAGRRIIPSPEPCLNCTCSKGILLCYLRTCSTVVATPECEVVRRKGDCCPKLVCNKGTTDYRADRTSEPNYKYRLRQDDDTFFGLIGLDARTERSSAATTMRTTRKSAPNFLFKDEDWTSGENSEAYEDLESEIVQEEDYSADELSEKHNTTEYCYSKGYKYTDGMAMLSSTKCEYCYCIRGQQMCVRPKCHLNIDGCVAKFQSGYTCCPSHYQCEIEEKIEEHPLTTSSESDVPITVSSCNVEGYNFDVGVAVPSSGRCQTCYCTQVGVVCRRLECSPRVPGCTPIIPEGHCCPTEYKCDQGENETEVPVSHSTENFDVTVISPSEIEESVSSDAYEIETTEDINYDSGDDREIYHNESTPDTTTKSQKITVELTDDSNLESISVIPEENIAVLVVTTESKSGEDIISETADGTRFISDITRPERVTTVVPNLKQKTKTSTTKISPTESVETAYSLDTTKPYLIPLTNLKQKIKTSTVKDVTSQNDEITFPQGTTKSNILHLKQKPSTTKTLYTEQADEIVRTTPYYFTTRNTFSETKHNTHPTTQTYSTHKETYYDYEDEDDDKDYGYDYVELYEDVPLDKHKTFAPFSDYSETLTPVENTQKTTLNTRFKIKNKKPSSSSQTRTPTTQTETGFTNSKFATHGLNSDRIIENETNQDSLTQSTSYTETVHSDSYPTRYTIYSTKSDNDDKPYVTILTGNQKQKTKPSIYPIHSTSAEYVLINSQKRKTKPNIQPIHSTSTESVLAENLKQKTKPSIQPIHSTITEYVPIGSQKQKTKPSTQPTHSTSIEYFSIGNQKQKTKSTSQPSHSTITEYIPIVNQKQKTKPNIQPFHSTIAEYVPIGSQKQKTKPSTHPTHSTSAEYFSIGSQKQKTKSTSQPFHSAITEYVPIVNQKQKTKPNIHSFHSTIAEYVPIGSQKQKTKPSIQPTHSTSAEYFSIGSQKQKTKSTSQPFHSAITEYIPIVNQKQKTKPNIQPFHSTIAEYVPIGSQKQKTKPSIQIVHSISTEATSISGQKQKTKPSTEPTHSTSVEYVPIGNQKQNTKPSTQPTHFTNVEYFSVGSQKHKTKPNIQPIHSSSTESTFIGGQKQKTKPDIQPIHSNNTESILIGSHKQKTKTSIQPMHSISPEYSLHTTQDSTLIQSRNPQISTRIFEEEEHSTTSDVTTGNTYHFDTSRPSLQFMKQHNKIISNHKQRPQRPPQITSHKSTKPLPQDIATLLRTITQNYKTETQDTSTEVYDPARGDQPFLDDVDYPIYKPDSEPTFIIAAPKLIVEDTTAHDGYDISQYDTTNSGSSITGDISTSNDSSLPNFNFQSHKIIFSNHGPSSSHKHPPTNVQTTDPPVVINNHKKTTSRIRPPIRFRPPSTPSIPQTSFIEISNHRPTNSFRRPPAKFPPYPSHNQRSETEDMKETHPRNPHHKLHRLDNHPEWREDYDEYYYDFEQSRNPTTKVFTNFPEFQTTGTINVQTSDFETYLPGTGLTPSTRKNGLNSNTATVASREVTNSLKRTSLETFETTTKIESSDEISGRSDDKEVVNGDPTLQTTISTTPLPSTNSDIITSTKTFLRYPTPENEGKLFRADDKKGVETSFIDEGKFEGKPNKFEVMEGRFTPEKPVPKPLSSKPSVSSVQPIDPPQPKDDSKEISDVCFVDGRYYNSGEIIIKSNPCEMCRCFYGHPLCQVQQCPAPPEPSCILEYLPGYCCPRVTCGVKPDLSQPSSDISAPDQAGQDIRPPIITSDNQWKPLPHGPIVRPAEFVSNTQNPGNIPKVVTVPTKTITAKGESKNNFGERADFGAENAVADEIKEKKTTEVVTFNAADSATSTVAVTQATPYVVSAKTSKVPSLEVTTYFPNVPITTSSSNTPLDPIFDPKLKDYSSQRNKTDIHDNSSGVRKVLNNTVTLPLSKMSLSPSSGNSISTVLPVIQPLQRTVIPNTEVPEVEMISDTNVVLHDLPAELGGNLKVSGCNVYGRYYNINDKVTALSKKCSDCICSVDGITCNKTC